MKGGGLSPVAYCGVSIRGGFQWMLTFFTGAAYVEFNGRLDRALTASLYVRVISSLRPWIPLQAGRGKGGPCVPLLPRRDGSNARDRGPIVTLSSWG